MDDWPLFHHDNAQSGVSLGDGPASGELAWKFRTGVAAYYSPSIEDGLVYVTSPGRAYVLFCLEARTGKVVWRASRPNFAGHGTNSTPVLHGPWVIVSTVRGYLYWIDKKDGRLVRECCLGGERVYSSPVCHDGLIYVGTRSSEKENLFCVDADTGETVWNYRTGGVDSTPFVSGDNLVVGSIDGNVYCFARRGAGPGGKGELIWRFATMGPVFASPGSAQGRVCVGSTDGIIYCLDESSGRLLWKTPAGGKVMSGSAYLGEHVYAGSDDGNLYCLDLASGAVLWRFSTGDYIRSSPTVASGRIFVTSLDGYLYSLALPEAGSRDVPRLEWKANTGHRVFSSPVVSDEEGLVMTIPADLFLRAFSIAGGHRVWQKDLRGKIYQNGKVCQWRPGLRAASENLIGEGCDQSSPAVAAGKVYKGADDHFIYALDEQTGKMVWRFETGYRVCAAPVYSQGRIFVGTMDGRFCCLDAGRGTVVWEKALGNVWAPANVVGGRVFVAGVNGRCYCLRREDGEVIWDFQTGNSCYSSPAFADDRVFFGSWDSYLYAFNVDGKLLWKFKTLHQLDSGSPAAVDGKVFFGACRSGQMFCVDAATGEVIWKFEVDGKPTPAGVKVATGKVFKVANSTPAIAGGRVVFAGVEDLYCVDEDGSGDGTTRLFWKFPGAGMHSAPAIARGKVYFGCHDGFVYCLDLLGSGDGTIRVIWKRRVLGGFYEGSAAIANGRLFIGSIGGFLYGFGPAQPKE